MGMGSPTKKQRSRGRRQARGLGFLLRSLGFLTKNSVVELSLPFSSSFLVLFSKRSSSAITALSLCRVLTLRFSSSALPVPSSLTPPPKTGRSAPSPLRTFRAEWLPCHCILPSLDLEIGGFSCHPERNAF